MLECKDCCLYNTEACRYGRYALEHNMSLNCDDFIVEHNKAYQQGRADAINAIKNDLHKRLTEEMNKPYQDQGLCQGLYFGIQRCDWYLDDGKEQKDGIS